MKPIAELLSLAERACRALLVIVLEQIATLLTRASVRMYARGLLSGVEIRLLLGFASAIHRRCIHLLRSAK
ncbi:hypothetical protein [Pseudomonas chlororaphis]|uniref:Uncharacterized protein n=1 Tax=Pseudomonas chlororaphis TaxID=587753 RepID=A0A1Q8EQ76_9PSED|nr:hypothetical protein [Pseudomonas chlororaphis]OLF53952.1 hypothetical protein BTN82_12900 [Pseudomonas chlororaphis]